MRRPDHRTIPTLLSSLALVLLSAAAVGAAFAEYTFRWANPIPQGNWLTALAFENDAVAYAVGNKGTVLATTDGGETWTDRTAWPEVEADLHDLVILAPGELLAAGDPPGLFRSLDGGMTWSPIDNPSTGTLYNLEEIAPGVLGAVGEGGEVVRSTDAGATWEAKTPTGAQRLVEQLWLDPLEGYVVGEFQGRRTLDGGETWELIPGFDQWEGFTNVKFLDEQHGFLFGDFDTWETTDHGATWEQVGVHFPAPIYQRQVILYDARHRLVTTGLEGAQIWETFDNGESWTMHHERMSAAGFPDLVELPGGRLLMVSTDGDLKRSDDGGATWTNATFSFGGDERVTFDALASLPGGIRIAAGNGSSHTGIPMLWLRSEDGGATWQELDAPPSMAHVHDLGHFGDAFLVAVGYEASVDRVCTSVDGGSTWQDGELPVPYQLLGSVTVPSETTAYALARGDDQTQIWRTTDQGADWERRDDGLPPTEDLYDVHFYDEQNGFVCGGWAGDADLFRTTDGGGTWTRMDTPGLPESTLREMHWFDASTAILSTYYALYRTTTGGADWTLVDDVDGARVIHFRDELHGAVRETSEGTLRVTEDGGATWTSIDLPFPGPYGGVVAVEGGFLLGGQGSVILEGRDPDAAGVGLPDRDPARVLLGPGRPNPFTAGTRVAYRLPETSRVRMTVHDANGRLVRVLADGTQPAGDHFAIWNGHADSGRPVPSGTYFLRLAGPEGRQGSTQRITLLR
ncbi:MAG: hypothetical protein GF346_01590 [Candidatus Eisenbacteria bacterium]|nr:hypothetical protein [Candidatus Latescibacterota bacterium]MBD3301123.1 hypothetical protein [Candidatus Eisenbacteria bacterium]